MLYNNTILLSFHSKHLLSETNFIRFLYKIRQDGFCAIEGLGSKSMLITKPLEIRGGELFANFNAMVGSISFALLDANGKEIDGFGFDNFAPIEGADHVEKKIEWENADLSCVRGKRVRIDVKLAGALLFSLSFEDAPWLCEPQKDFANLKSIRNYEN